MSNVEQLLQSIQSDLLALRQEVAQLWQNGPQPAGPAALDHGPALAKRLKWEVPALAERGDILKIIASSEPRVLGTRGPDNDKGKHNEDKGDVTDAVTSKPDGNDVANPNDSGDDYSPPDPK